MMKKSIVLLSLMMLWTVAGCGTDPTVEIAALQEKVAKITQQLDETKKQVDGLQEANQRAVQAIENLTATIGRSNVAAPPAATAGKAPTKALVEQDLPPSSSKQRGALTEPPAVAAFTASPSATTAEGYAPPQERAHPLDTSQKTSESHLQKSAADSHFSCGRVWKQMGEGKSAEAVAHALGSSVEAVQRCEQKIGRRVVK